jgi:small-conductance mechanosensitive channel
MLEGLARTLHMSRSVFYSIVLAVLIIGALAVGYAFHRVLRHWTRKFQNTWGEIIFALLESLPIPLTLLSALYIGLEALALPRQYERIGSKIILGLVLLVLFYFPAKVLILFLRRASQKDPSLERITQPATFLIRAIFAILGIIVFLENLGISLTAVWTTLGVGSVAVALALQETLSNFFSGLYLLADRPVSPGDYIKLDVGQEGYVVQIGWRSTRLRTLGNNILVIPNATLAKAVITNYSMPEDRMSLDIRVRVAYGFDPRRVEKILTEVAQETAQDRLEGLLAHPEPSAKYIPGFGDSWQEFTLSVQIRRFVDQYAVQSELRKRVQERFQKEGIEIAVPTQAIILEKSLMDMVHRPGGDSDSQASSSRRQS